MNKHSLLTKASIEAWIADNQPGGEDKLAARLVGGMLGADGDRSVLAYFAGDTDRLRVAERVLAQSLAGPARQPSGGWALRAAEVAPWIGQIAIVLALVAIILMPFWSA